MPVVQSILLLSIVSVPLSKSVAEAVTDQPLPSPVQSVAYISSSEVNWKLKQGLHLIAEFAGVDRTYVVQFNENPVTKNPISKPNQLILYCIV